MSTYQMRISGTKVAGKLARYHWQKETRDNEPAYVANASEIYSQDPKLGLTERDANAAGIVIQHDKKKRPVHYSRPA